MHCLKSSHRIKKSRYEICIISTRYFCRRREWIIFKIDCPKFIQIAIDNRTRYKTRFFDHNSERFQQTFYDFPQIKLNRAEYELSPIKLYFQKSTESTLLKTSNIFQTRHEFHNRRESIHPLPTFCEQSYLD